MYEAVKDAGDYQSNYLEDYYQSEKQEGATPITAFLVYSCLLFASIRFEAIMVSDFYHHPRLDPEHKLFGDNWNSN